MPRHDDIAVLRAPVLDGPGAEPEPLTGSGNAEDDLAALVERLHQLDQELLSLIRHRTAVARQLPGARAAAGRPGFHHADELHTARHFAALGEPGGDLFLLLLRLARRSR